jgi:S-adenosylmethionine hydrolase
MIFLYTDFGVEGPYVGQMRAAIARHAPQLPVIDLCHDLAPFDSRSAAYLLAALVPWLPPAALVVGVVDPGVGSARKAVVLQADGRRFIGPDNGLFSQVARRAQTAHWQELLWHPPILSASFHGRDLFAPAAAQLAQGITSMTGDLAQAPVGGDWPQDLAQIIYVDRYGNAMTGIRACHLQPDRCLKVGGRLLSHALTFSAVPVGAAFWYENANGLVEIAVNQGRADEMLTLTCGSAVTIT